MTSETIHMIVGYLLPSFNLSSATTILLLKYISKRMHQLSGPHEPPWGGTGSRFPAQNSPVVGDGEHAAITAEHKDDRRQDSCLDTGVS